MQGWWLFALGVIALAGVVTKVLHSYTDLKRVGWAAFIIVWIGWFLNFAIILLLPIDVANVTYENCMKHKKPEDTCGGGPWIIIDTKALEILWAILYWTIYVMCWTLFPITQSYSMTGEFTFMEKFRAAIKDNIKFYLIAGGIGIVFLLAVVLYVTSHDGNFGFTEIIAMCVGGSNAWGMLLLMIFLGYSLVEIPKYFWKHATHERMLNYNYFLAVSYREKCVSTKRELDNVLKRIKKYSEKIQKSDPYRPFLETIIEKCPLEYKDIQQGEGDGNVTYNKLVTLHYDLKHAEHETLAARSVYVNLLDRTFQLQDIIRSYHSSDHTIRWSFKSQRTHRFGRLVDTLEWFYQTWLHALIFRTITILYICVAAAIVWSEMFFNINSRYPHVNLSIFSLVLNSHNNFSFESVWLFVFLPLAFLTASTLWGLFRMRVLGYRLIPHHNSNTPSLLFFTMYISRLVAVVAYNFLYMIVINPKKEQGVHLTQTAYYTVWKPLSRVPPTVGEGFNMYFPIVLVVFVLATMFDMYNKFILTFCIKRFRKNVYDEHLSDSTIGQGREIVEHERNLKENGMSLSIDNVLPTKNLVSRMSKSSSSSELYQNNNNSNNQNEKKHSSSARNSPMITSHSPALRSSSPSKEREKSAPSSGRFPNFKSIFVKSTPDIHSFDGTTDDAETNDRMNLLEKGTLPPRPNRQPFSKKSSKDLFKQ